MKGPGWRFSQLETLTGILFRMSHAEWPFLWWLIILVLLMRFIALLLTCIWLSEKHVKKTCDNSQIRSSLNWTVVSRSKRSMGNQIDNLNGQVDGREYNCHGSAGPSTLSRVIHGPWTNLDSHLHKNEQFRPKVHWWPSTFAHWIVLIYIVMLCLFWYEWPSILVQKFYFRANVHFKGR